MTSVREIEYDRILELIPPLSDGELQLLAAQIGKNPCFANLARLREADGTMLQGLFLDTATGVLCKLARNADYDPVWLEVTGDIEYETQYYQRMYYDVEDPE
jgi:hypothetical protein